MQPVLNKLKTEECVVLFAHIPKAAGTTLNRFIEQQYNPLSIFTIGGYRPMHDMCRFQEFSRDKRFKYRVVKGHGAWFLRDCQVKKIRAITLLRDPIKRVISSYNYARSNTKHHFHIQSSECSLAEYVTEIAHDELLNGQVRALSMKVADYTRTISSQDLEDVKASIENHFVVVGLSEFFYESVALICLELGWNPKGIASQNITPQTQSKQSVSQSEIDKLREVVSLDIELYQWAKKRFELEVVKHSLEVERIVDSLNQPSGYSELGMKIRACLSRIASR